MRVCGCDDLADMVSRSRAGKLLPAGNIPNIFPNQTKPNLLTETSLMCVCLHRLRSRSNTAHLQMRGEHRGHRLQRQWQAVFKRPMIALETKPELPQASNIVPILAAVYRCHESTVWIFDVQFCPSFSALYWSQRSHQSLTLIHFIKYNYQMLLMVNIN